MEYENEYSLFYDNIFLLFPEPLMLKRLTFSISYWIKICYATIP